MSTLWFDARSAFRQVARHRAFSAMVIVTLALGIGTTTTFFSVLNAFVFRPLPFTDADRLVAVRGLLDTGTVAPSYEAVARLPRSPFLAVVAYTAHDVAATTPDGAQRALATAVSGDIFALLGARFGVGRPLLPRDVGATTPGVVVSHAFWTRHYAADPSIVGRTLALDRVPHAIVGVAPEGFAFPDDTDIWVPLDVDPRGRPRRVDVVARLAGGVSVAQAGARLSALWGADAPRDAPGARRGPDVIALHDAVVSAKHRAMLTSLLTATLFVLLIACGNLAGMLAAHLDSRRHEIATRVALGGGRSRVVRLLLIESVVLATAGGALGILVAEWGVDSFAAVLGKPQGAAWLSFTIDARVLLFAFGASLLTAVLFGLGPAIGASGVDLRGVLQDDGRTVGVSRRGRRMRALLVAAQIAVSLGLISAAWSIIDSATSFAKVSPGLDTSRLAVLHVTLRGSAYDDVPSRRAFVQRGIQSLGAIPGISGATATTALPLADRNVPFASIVFEGAEANAPGVPASVRYVLGTYPGIAGVPIRLGRSFSDAEAADPNAALVLVNDAMARRYWPGADPIGKRFRLAGSQYPETWLTVTGVVGGVSQRNPGDDPGNQIYLPLAAARDGEVSFVVRAAGDEQTIVAPARRAIAALDKDLPIDARTMGDVFGWFESDRAGQGFVIAALGTVALLLAALGVYGIMSLLVAQQRQEFAIRLALGCSVDAVARLVLARGFRLASRGIAGGLVLGGLLTMGLSRIFYGVRPFELAPVLGGAALLIATALAASWWPARRAMRVDPIASLRR